MLARQSRPARAPRNVYDTIDGARAQALPDRRRRIDWGPGYRVYFGRDGEAVIVLLCGGDKRRQNADIERAVALWQEYGDRKKRDSRAKR
jgi:hypothetical protein